MTLPVFSSLAEDRRMFTAIPSQAFTGTTMASVPVPPWNGRALLSVDCTGWTIPTTVEIALELSVNGGTNWKRVASAINIGPPPWTTEDGQTSTMSIAWHPGTWATPTHARTVIIVGSAVVLGDAIVGVL